MRSHKHLEQKANQILSAAGIDQAPIDVFHVAEVLGARIQPEIVSDDISGALNRHEDGPVIGFNAQHPPNRQRFTIAHEIAHLVLHEDEAVFVDRVFRREVTSGDAIDPIEIEANSFAAALLMPAHLLQADHATFGRPLSSEDVEQLARTYNVSQQAMTFRLDNLRLSLQQA